MMIKLINFLNKERGRKSSLAKELKVLPQVVNSWRVRKSVPAAYCIQIEQYTKGAVTRYDLRPDVFGATPDVAMDGFVNREQVKRFLQVDKVPPVLKSNSEFCGQPYWRISHVVDFAQRYGIN